MTTRDDLAKLIGQTGWIRTLARSLASEVHRAEALAGARVGRASPRAHDTTHSTFIRPGLVIEPS